MRELLEALDTAPAEYVKRYYSSVEDVLNWHKTQLNIKRADAGAHMLNQREQLLQEAIRITTSDRNKAYGNPEDNFANIAAYWMSYLTQAKKCDIIITPQDVAHLMILMKMARLATNPAHRDSLLDVAGYAACAADCQQVPY